jgi:hypothetical protein
MDVKLAEVWQVERNGETIYELHMPVDTDRMPVGLLGQAVYADIVCKATELALANARRIIQEADAVTPT